MSNIYSNKIKYFRELYYFLWRIFTVNSFILWYNFSFLLVFIVFLSCVINMKSIVKSYDLFLFWLFFWVVYLDKNTLFCGCMVLLKIICVALYRFICYYYLLFWVRELTVKNTVNFSYFWMVFGRNCLPYMRYGVGIIC